MTKTPRAEQVPVNIVGSSKFGRYSKINDEKTFNMFISDGWLVNYAGYKYINQISSAGVGRGIFHSIRGNFLLAVVGATVFRIDTSFNILPVGSLATGSGEVIIDENLNQQIAIADGTNIYIYNWSLNTLTTQALGISGIQPDYVTYHNTYFLIGNSDSTANGAKWYVFEYATDTTISQVTIGGEQALENKPDTALAAVRLPGKGNNIIVFGKTVAAIFTQVGGQLLYQRHSSSNIDYGVVSVNTIATSDEMVCWLSQNENNAPVIMVSTGGVPQRLSTDGIDYLLGQINVPQDSTAFFYRQDGHLFYQITFFNSQDNKTLTYDFNTEGFFILTDEKQDYYPIRQIVYFNNRIYGISLNDGNLYEISSNVTQYIYNDRTEDIPRMRFCKAIRKNDSSRFISNLFTMWIEQGEDEEYVELNLQNPCNGYLINEQGIATIVTEDDIPLQAQGESCLLYTPHVDVRFSKNGGQSFSNIKAFPLNTVGKFRNQFRVRELGQANEIIIQLNFWTRSRTVAGNGVIEVRQ